MADTSDQEKGWLISLKTVLILNIVLCFIGAAFFGALFGYVSLAPKDFEHRVQGFVVAEVEQKLNETIPASLQDRLGQATGLLSERFRERAEETRRAIEAGIPQFIAAVVAAMCRLDCHDQQALEATVLGIYEKNLTRLRLGVDRLRQMVEDRYVETLSELRTDIRIFLGSNTAVMTLALGLALFRGPAARHLLPFSLVLTGATLLASTWYVFGQDWVLNVVYADYWGWSYLILLGVIFAFLVDIAINRARITSRILNWIANAVGGIPSLAPC